LIDDVDLVEEGRQQPAPRARVPVAQPSIKLPSGSGERSLGCPADRLFALGSRARALGPLGVLVDADVHRRLLEPERWIIAGDYWAVAGERFTDTDTVVWLDLPRRLCWWRVCFRRNSVLEIACI